MKTERKTEVKSDTIKVTMDTTKRTGRLLLTKDLEEASPPSQEAIIKRNQRKPHKSTAAIIYKKRRK